MKTLYNLPLIRSVQGVCVCVRACVRACVCRLLRPVSGGMLTVMSDDQIAVFGLPVVIIAYVSSSVRLFVIIGRLISAGVRRRLDLEQFTAPRVLVTLRISTGRLPLPSHSACCLPSAFPATASLCVYTCVGVQHRSTHGSKTPGKAVGLSGALILICMHVRVRVCVRVCPTHCRPCPSSPCGTGRCGG